MRIDIVTAFPNMVRPVFEESILKRAADKGVVYIHVWDLRDFTTDKHKTVDDYPYGGGPGMILKPEPLFKAVDAIRREVASESPRIILMTPQGERFSQEKARELAAESHLIFLCGHYRGVDERVVEALITDEISIGDYVLTGGELAAAVIADAAVRLLPGVLGDFDSAEADSFQENRLDHPHYTRPEVFRDMRVPEVLLSGHHARIEAWRQGQSEKRTQERRPDLLDKKT